MNNITTYKEIKSKILEMISTLPENTKIKSRNYFAELFSVNTATVNRAVSELIGEGYLYSKDKSGTYVSHLVYKKNNQHDFKIWGVLVPDITNKTYPEIFRAIEDCANKRGAQVILCNTDGEKEKQLKYIKKLITSNVEGVIIIPPIYLDTNDKSFSLLEKAKIPFVFCNRAMDLIKAPCVRANNFYGGFLATFHLAKKGCKKIAYISKPQYTTSVDRYQGYLSALEMSNIKQDSNLVYFEKAFDHENIGYDAAISMLKKNKDIDGFFCFTDIIAVNVCKAIMDKGLKVGKDIKVIGYDNTDICEALPTTLSSISFENYEVGKLAGELLIDLIDGKEDTDDHVIILNPKLVERESTM